MGQGRHHNIVRQNSYDMSWAANPPSVPYHHSFIMSHTASASASSSRFESIFNSALDAYEKRTKQDLPSHPLLPRLQSCNSADAIIAVLREQIPAFSQSQASNDRFSTWLIPTVNVLCAFSAALGEGVGLVNTTMFLFRDLRSNVCSPGISACESYLCRSRCSLFGSYLLGFPWAVLTFNSPRLPKM